MEVSLNHAVKRMYKDVSLNTVLSEAVANSLDANSKKIDIIINASQFTSQKKTIAGNISITVSDDGIGFDNNGIKKFTTLYLADDKHKGMGRLSYLRLFSDVCVETTNLNNKNYKFKFDEHLTKDSILNSLDHTNTQQIASGTKIILKKASQNIKISDLDVNKIKKDILFNFLGQFLFKKENKDDFEINIHKTISFPEEQGVPDYIDSSSLSLKDIYPFEKTSLKIDTITYDCYYYFEKSLEEYNFIAINIDGRAMPIQSLCKGKIGNQRIIFIVNNIQGVESDLTRQKIEISDSDFNKISKAIYSKLDSVVMRSRSVEFSKLKSSNISFVLNRRPYLLNFVDRDKLGFSSAADVEKTAEDEFNKAKRDFFNTSVTNEKEFNKSFNIASAILSEYMISRFHVLDNLKGLSEQDKECVIHDLLLPRKKIKGNSGELSISQNNLWVINESFMSYYYVFSDIEIKQFIAKINSCLGKDVLPVFYPESEALSRPDFAIVMSDRPEKDNITGVIIEIKKRNTDRKDIIDLMDELQRRANAIHDNCKNIRRCWYFGIADLKNVTKRDFIDKGYIQLYSLDDCFYKSHSIVDINTGQPSGVADLYIMSYDAVIKDAESRLSTFRNILIEAFNNSLNENKS